MTQRNGDGRGKSDGSRRTYFKKGESPNPSGRRKGAKNVRTLFNQAASEKIRVREGDKVRTREIADTIIREDLKNAARGKSQAVDRYYKNADRYQRSDEDASAADIEEDKEIVKAFLKRYDEYRRGCTPDEDPQTPV